MRTVRTIDKDHNGYITTTEMSDILKLHYPQLRSADLNCIVKRFRSIQNKVLIDYK